MRRNPFIILFCLAVLSLLKPCTLGAADFDYDFGNPTPYEQLHLELINRARANPLEEAARTGIDLMEGVPSGLLTSDPKPPLAMSAKLIAAAREHTVDMLMHNYFSHDSLDGKSPFQRMSEIGYSYTLAGENIAFMSSSRPRLMEEATEELHEILFVDENFPNRTHRTTLLDPNLKEAGIGIQSDDYETGGIYFPYAYMVTCDFGARSNMPSILTGVVIDDRDGDAFYDVGEGIKGVEIVVEGLAEHFHTADSGGYGIPLWPSNYSVTFIHEQLGRVERTIEIGSENVKLDIFKTDFSREQQQNEIFFNVNKTWITKGDNLLVSVDVSGIADLYIFAILPSGDFVCFTDFNTAAGLNQAATFQPSVGAVLDFIWPDSPGSAGTYYLGAALVKTGTDPLVGRNWLDSKIVRLDVVF